MATLAAWSGCGDVPLDPYEIDPKECETPYEVGEVTFEFRSWGDKEFSGDCTIQLPTASAPLVIEMDLNCFDGNGRHLELKGIEGASELVGAFRDGQVVSIEWLNGGCFECPDAQWITVRDEQGQLLAWGVDGQRWLPESGEIAMPLPHPLTLDLSAGYCEPKADFCGTRELGTLEMTLGGETFNINSNEQGVVGLGPRYVVQAGAVQYYSDLSAEECERLEPWDVQLLAVRQ